MSPTRKAPPEPRSADTLWRFISRYDACAEALAVAARQAHVHRRGRAGRRTVVDAFATHARRLRSHGLADSEVRVVLLALYHVGAERQAFGEDTAAVDQFVLDLIAEAVASLSEPDGAPGAPDPE